MATFKDWLSISEGNMGFVIASIYNAISLNEGRKNASKLQNRPEIIHKTGNLFHRERGIPSSVYQGVDEPLLGPNGEPITGLSCEKTPLSGFHRHINQIKNYAFQGPDQLAFTMMFSPLSANTSFSKHWDNMQVLKLILKHYFPNKVDKNELEKILDGFADYQHSMSHTITSWKFDTITDIWNKRYEFYNKLKQYQHGGVDIEQMISEFCKIKGVQPVKAGFIVQLLFGEAGCIDTHNVDIYKKVFPHLKEKLNPDNWMGSTNPVKQKESIKKYVSLLNDLKKYHGIGSSQLWDVWCDFVEHFYLITGDHDLGSYAQMGSSIDKNAPEYDPLKGIIVPKTRPGVRDVNRKYVDVPLIGPYGMGASATHLQSDPDEMLQQTKLVQDYKKAIEKGEEPGKKPWEGARAVPMHSVKVKGLGHEIEKSVGATQGLGAVPSIYYYFAPAIGKHGEINHDAIVKIINHFKQIGGKKARKEKIMSIDKATQPYFHGFSPD